MFDPLLIGSFAMFKTTATAILVSAAALGLAACDVEKTQEGNVNLPKYDVQKTQEGTAQLPKYDVKTPDVNVTTEKKTIEVPKVDVTTAKEKEAQSMGAGAAEKK